jgi:Cytochrome P450
MQAVDVTRIVAVAAACAVGFALFKVLLLGLQTVDRRRRLRGIPVAPGSVPFLGHLFALIKHPLPWERMLDWCNECSTDIVHWKLPFEDWIIVRGGEAMRTTLQTRFKDFNKEVAMSFHPFLCILGTGLVTSHGQLWQKQRRLMTPAFKGDILQEVIDISVRATARLSAKLDASQASGATVEIDEEFRLLTLQARRRSPLHFSVKRELRQHAPPVSAISTWNRAKWQALRLRLSCVHAQQST